MTDCIHVHLTKQVGPMDGGAESKRYACQCGENFTVETQRIEVQFGSPRKVGEDGPPEKYERTHSRVWVNAWNAALEEVCGLVAVNGSELDFGPFSIGHNPKRVQQEHTMIVELIRALKHPVPALRSSSVPVGEPRK